MTTRSMLAVLASAAAVAAIVSAGVAVRHVAQASPDASRSIGAAAPADLPCAPDAAADLTSVTDERVRADAAANGYSVAPKGEPLSRERAADIARSLSSADSTTRAALRTAAIEAPYRLVSEWFGDDNPLIAADRCVLVVTVDGPYQVPRAPMGVERPSFDRYSVALDEASGQFVSMAAGPTAPDVLDGTNLAAAK